MERSRWLVWLFVTVQFAVPLAAQAARLLTGVYTRYGWMMYS